MLHEHHFRAMNTHVGIWLWCANAECAATVDSRLRWAERFFGRVEDELSRFRASSGLTALNQAAGQGPQAVSPLLWTVLQSALKAADETGGIYDPTLLRTIERLGYDRSFERIEPSDAAVTDTGLPPFGSWRRVGVDRTARSISLPRDLAIDLGGLGKGWTVDHVTVALARLGPVLADAGGDLRVVGVVEDEAWPIAVQNPFEPERNRAVLRLCDGALATSSIGGRRWQRGRRTLHHVIDPRTGLSAESDLYAVTVRAPTATTADVAAKVVLVLGSVSGIDYLHQRGLSGLLTARDGHEVVVGDFLNEGDCHAWRQCA